MLRKDPLQRGRRLHIKRSLETLCSTYGAAYLHTDPLQFVHRYKHPEDQELAGFLAAVFAYGQVPQILATLERVFAPFPDRILPALLRTPASGYRSLYRNFSHRFQGRQDLLELLHVLRETLCEYGSLESAFLVHYLPVKDHPEAMRLALTGWTGALRDRLPVRRAPRGDPASRRGSLHLLPDPACGSPCKRWNLYLRWMVRGPDGMDLGLWPSVDRRKLILPLDTHTARISRYLGFTGRTTPSWAMAEEITHALRALDPEDPVRYDFALARLGIVNRCSQRAGTRRCAGCALEAVCLTRGSVARRASEPGRGTSQRSSRKTPRQG